METSEILRAIVAHCSDEKLVLWAAREMQRSRHFLASLATNYRKAISTGSLPEDLVQAMQEAIDGNDARSTLLQIRLSRREREKLDENAQEAGVSVSEYVRDRCCQ